MHSPTDVRFVVLLVEINSMYRMHCTRTYIKNIQIINWGKLENIKISVKQIKYNEVDWSLLAQDVDKGPGGGALRMLL